MAQNSLAVLMKSAQQQLDLLSKEAAEAQERLDLQRAQFAAIQARVEIEKAQAVALNMTALLPAFMTRARAETQDVEREIKAAEADIEAVRGRLQKAYAEKSKYELLINQRDAAAAAKAAAAAQAELDEVAAAARAV